MEKSEKDAPGEETPVLKGSELKMNSFSEPNSYMQDSKEDFGVLSNGKLILLNITWYGINLMYLVLCVVVVPAQIQAMVGQAAKGRWLGGIVATGALLSLVAGPLIGMISDRMVCRYGKRRPIMFVSTVVLCLGLFGMALSSPDVHYERVANSTCEPVDLVEKRCRPYQNATHLPLAIPGSSSQQSEVDGISNLQPDVERFVETKSGNLALYITFYLMAMMSLVALHVPYNGLIADKSPPQQRGSTSGVMGSMILLGNISGAIIGIFFVSIGVLGTYALVSVLLCISVLTTVFTIGEEPSKVLHDPIKWKVALCEYIEPFKERDFRWVFFTRFLMQQGIATVTGFLEYWISDVIELPNCLSPHSAIGIILLPLLFTAAACSVLAGCMSDKWNRRKPIVITSACIMSGVAIVFAVIRGPYAFYVVLATALVFGIGYGSFVAVDFAIVLDVLPTDKDRAKDIAIWSFAFVLPQVLATPTGGIIIDMFEYVNCEIGLGYIILFSVTAVYFLLSGAFVTRIVGVK
ncbi:uncharacterized protein [Ptychodera flava]|uniref:uncharacterized protein n=1 Tax=Ptychodera flava TaxID=63121 RepID=UPI00396A8709